MAISDLFLGMISLLLAWMGVGLLVAAFRYSRRYLLVAAGVSLFYSLQGIFFVTDYGAMPAWLFLIGISLKIAYFFKYIDQR
jgi:hypothetical protein